MRCIAATIGCFVHVAILHLSRPISFSFIVLRIMLPTWNTSKLILRRAIIKLAPHTEILTWHLVVLGMRKACLCYPRGLSTLNVLADRRGRCFLEVVNYSPAMRCRKSAARAGSGRVRWVAISRFPHQDGPQSTPCGGACCRAHSCWCIRSVQELYKHTHAFIDAAVTAGQQTDRPGPRARFAAPALPVSVTLSLCGISYSLPAPMQALRAATLWDNHVKGTLW